MNKRRYPRFATSKRIAYTCISNCGTQDIAGIGKILNISKTGILIKSDQKLLPDSGIELVLGIDKNTIHLKCRCIYSVDTDNRNADHSGYDTGIKIEKIKKDDFQIYLRFLKNLEEDPPDFSNIDKKDLNFDNLALKISGEHKLIAKYVVILRKITQKKGEQNNHVNVTIMLKLLKKDLIKHFHIEETFFFKPTYTLLPKEFQEMVLYLRNDHTKLLSELDVILSMISKNKSYLNRLISFTERLKSHARYEISEFYSFLESNRLIKSQIMTIMNKLYTSLH